ncbi:protein YgfX [Undibacterium sp. TJN19]|uniref:protein YgfX n=1 Tax=Undibacterium sp. TJN19 TaxID=3413055 RepID=UPI003BEFF501
MTIALLVEPKPSRLLLASCLSMLILAHLSLFLLMQAVSIPVYLKITLLLISLGASVWQMARWWAASESMRLSISDAGVMALHWQNEAEEQSSNLTVRLSAKSCLWPQLLSLFLIDEDDREHKLLILPDSLDPAAFRALRVSLMWISQHKQK